MKSAIRLFLVLLTLIVVLFAWFTHQLGEPRIQLLVILLGAVTLAAFFILNILDRREESRRRKERESRSRSEDGKAGSSAKRSDNSFALRDKKAGLTWGGGNIKAANATRGTKRKFLGK